MVVVVLVTFPQAQRFGVNFFVPLGNLGFPTSCQWIFLELSKRCFLDHVLTTHVCMMDLSLSDLEAFFSVLNLNAGCYRVIESSVYCSNEGKHVSTDAGTFHAHAYFTNFRTTVSEG